MRAAIQAFLPCFPHSGVLACSKWQWVSPQCIDTDTQAMKWDLFEQIGNQEKPSAHLATCRTEYDGGCFSPSGVPSHSLVDPPAQRCVRIKQSWVQHRANSLPLHNPPKWDQNHHLSRFKWKVPRWFGAGFECRECFDTLHERESVAARWPQSKRAPWSGAGGKKVFES